MAQAEQRLPGAGAVRARHPASGFSGRTDRARAREERERTGADRAGGAAYALSRPFAAPPDVPADRAKALQAAFLAVHRDPGYLEEAAKLRIDVSPIGGDEVLAAIDRIANAPLELLDYLRKLLADTKGG